jgi:hypothetical protein
MLRCCDIRQEEETRDLIAELLVLTGPVKPEVALDLSLHSDASDVAHCPLRASHRASAATLIDTQKDELVDDILHHLEQYLVRLRGVRVGLCVEGQRTRALRGQHAYCAGEHAAPLSAEL